MGTTATSLGQPAGRTDDASAASSERNNYVDFTVVSGYLECLILLAALVLVGIAAALLKGS